MHVGRTTVITLKSELSRDNCRVRGESHLSSWTGICRQAPSPLLRYFIIQLVPNHLDKTEQWTSEKVVGVKRKASIRVVHEGAGPLGLKAGRKSAGVLLGEQNSESGARTSWMKVNRYDLLLAQ